MSKGAPDEKRVQHDIGAAFPLFCSIMPTDRIQDVFYNMILVLNFFTSAV
jgi:hypothetical protein